MSNKPIKKSDNDKDWINKTRNKQSKYIEPEYHLIVSEGTKTEPSYFEAIKENIELNYKGKINISIEGEGNNTVKLFNKAKEIALKSTNGFRHVWIIYDTDSFLAEDINKVVTLCKNNSSTRTTYHAIWSNQCVELWYILHFEYMHSDIDRRSYSNKITNYLIKLGHGKYKKNRTDMFSILQPYMETAIKNAQKLNKDNKNKTPSESKPGTEVFKLIDKLKTYIRM